MTYRPSSLEEENQRLTNELYDAQKTIISLMSKEIREALEGYSSCRTYEDAGRWRKEAIEKLLLLAHPKPAKEMDDYANITDRTYCPLCGGGADGYYCGKGYAFPDGLIRHLEGTHNSHRCPVFKAALDLCQSHMKLYK